MTLNRVYLGWIPSFFCLTAGTKWAALNGHSLIHHSGLNLRMISGWHFNSYVFYRKEGLKYQLETVTLNKAQALKWLVTVSPSYYVGGFISHMCPELEPVLNKDFPNKGCPWDNLWAMETIPTILSRSWDKDWISKIIILSKIDFYQWTSKHQNATIKD